MKTIYLQPTAIAQWHALVNEAQVHCDTQLGEDLESYLVFMLMRFVDQPEFSQNAVALEFLQSLHQSGRIKENSLQQVGDRCLLISGFYPDQIKRRRLKEDYYINLGKDAYYTLSCSTIGKCSTSQLFKHLSEAFLSLRNVLYTIRLPFTMADEDFCVKQKSQIQ